MQIGSFPWFFHFSNIYTPEQRCQNRKAHTSDSNEAQRFSVDLLSLNFLRLLAREIREGRVSENDRA